MLCHPISNGITVALAGLLMANALAAQSLTTTFASDNGRSVTPPVNLFDMTVTRPGGIRIVALDVNSMASINTPIEIDIYITPLTYIGNEQNSSVWIKISTGMGIAQGRNVPTPIDVADFTVPQGTIGVGIHYKTGGSAYTNGTGSNQNFSNADLSLQLGTVSAAFFTGGTFTPRVWNGTIHYHAGQATYGTYGTGCRGSNQLIPLLDPMASLPRINNNLTLNFSNLNTTPTVGFVLMGVSKSMFSGLPLPLDLAVIGASGCSLLVDPLLTFGVPSTGGTASLSLPIPNDPTLTGLQLFHQGVFTDMAANPLGLTFSNGGEGIVGT